MKSFGDNDLVFGGGLINVIDDQGRVRTFGLFSLRPSCLLTASKTERAPLGSEALALSVYRFLFT